MTKLFYNGFFHSKIRIEKLVTKNGLIVAINEACNNYNVDEKIDLKGYHIYPGFTDSHMHIIGYGRKLARPNLNGNLNKEQVLKIIKSLYQNQPLFIEGYFDIGLTKDDLDKVSTNNIILLRHNDYHSLTVNSKALKEGNIKSDNGILLDYKGNVLNDYFNKPSTKDLENWLDSAIKELYKYGITQVCSDDLSYFNGFEKTLSVLYNGIKKNPLRLNLLVHHSVLDDFLRLKPKENDYLKFDSIKVFYDGTFSSKTALIEEKYQETNSYGKRMQSKSKFQELLKKVRNNNMAVAVHVIGNKALKEVSYFLKKYPPNDNLTDRIIHASLASESIIDALSELRVSLDVQPEFISSDYPFSNEYINNYRYLYPFRSYIDNNILIKGSSDAPVENPNPLLGIYSAIKRQSKKTSEICNKQQAINFDEALMLYTLNANINNNKWKLGRIDIGYLADFVVFKEALETILLEDLSKTEVKMTIINGDIVYKNN